MQPIFHEDKSVEPFRAFMTRTYAMNKGKAAPALPQVDIKATYPVTLAYISEGRWVARCAACPGAVLVSRDLPYMLCVEPKCALDYEWQAVIMPAEDFEALGELVMRREYPVNQNWNTDELIDGDPVAFIRLENELHGVA